MGLQNRRYPLAGLSERQLSRPQTKTGPSLVLDSLSLSRNVL